MSPSAVRAKRSGCGCVRGRLSFALWQLGLDSDVLWGFGAFTPEEIETRLERALWGGVSWPQCLGRTRLQSLSSSTILQPVPSHCCPHRRLRFGHQESHYHGEFHFSLCHLEQMSTSGASALRLCAVSQLPRQPSSFIAQL